mgnify:CR=1 FL=1
MNIDDFAEILKIGESINTEFKSWNKVSDMKKVTGKPIVSGKDELNDNPRARSAKLRVIEKKRY